MDSTEAGVFSIVSFAKKMLLEHMPPNIKNHVGVKKENTMERPEPKFTMFGLICSIGAINHKISITIIMEGGEYLYVMNGMNRFLILKIGL